MSHHCSGCLALSINRRTQEVKTQPELLHQIMQLTIPVNQGNIKFGQKVECFGCQNTEFKATDQPNLRRGELSREQTRTREESFRRLQCEQSRTAHVMTTILKGGSKIDEIRPEERMVQPKAGGDTTDEKPGLARLEESSTPRTQATNVSELR